MINYAKCSKQQRQFLAEVLEGLRADDKYLLPKYFYDEQGSRLFDRITDLDEYYVTRTELGILRDHVESISESLGTNVLLIEFGAGSLAKVALILENLQQPAGFVPVDVSGAHLRASSKILAEQFPDLTIDPVIADFTKPFRVPSWQADRRVVYFSGSTIGNFDPADADKLLERIRGLVGRHGGVLLGVDLRKDRTILESAYNDSAGVTAAFNRNILVRINRELQADFVPSQFAHRAFYDVRKSRIEMHLVSRANQVVHLAGYQIEFERGESIHTENSYKYDLEELAEQTERAGLRLTHQWTDHNNYFALVYLTAIDRSKP